MYVIVEKAKKEMYYSRLSVRLLKSINQYDNKLPPYAYRSLSPASLVKPVLDVVDPGGAAVPSLSGNLKLLPKPRNSIQKHENQHPVIDHYNVEITNLGEHLIPQISWSDTER